MAITLKELEEYIENAKKINRNDLYPLYSNIMTNNGKTFNHIANITNSIPSSEEISCSGITGIRRSFTYKGIEFVDCRQGVLK